MRDVRSAIVRHQEADDGCAHPVEALIVCGGTEDPIVGLTDCVDKPDGRILSTLAESFAQGFDRHLAGGFAAAMTAESVRNDEQDFAALLVIEAAKGILIHASDNADVRRAGDQRLA
jgi:hypothetical protein